MKYLYLFFCFLFSFLYVSSQTICIDSSSHFRYKTLPNDSLRISKTILTKDSSKITLGFFIKKFAAASDTFFISKISKSGNVEWFKKITSPDISSLSEFQNIEEAANGNLIIAGINPPFTTKPFFYIIVSSAGVFLYQNAFDITNTGVSLSNAAPLQVSCIIKYDADSMLLCITHPALRSSEGSLAITILIISNNGFLGSAYTFTPPSPSFYNPYYSKCKIEGNYIYLYGGAHFANTCMAGFFDQPSLTYLKINWETKQVVDKKAYCGPPVGYDQFGYPFGEGVDNRNIIISGLTNENIIIYRQIWGFDFDNGDTLTRLFKISEFDKDFNHLRSEYICTRKRFNWWLEWYYHLFVDSLSTKHISIFDLPGQKIYYALENSQGNFLLQKQMPHIASRIDRFSRESKRLFTEPGYLTSFDIVSGDEQQSYIDNFRILAKDTAAACFGTNIDLLISKPAAVSLIDWQGDFTSRQAILEMTAINFTLKDYPLEKTIVCNILHKCDTIKIHAPDTVCNISIPIIVTVHKNPFCDDKVNFSFDTAQVKSYLQMNDTTISLSFDKSCTFKLFARLSACTQLLDSVTMNVSAPLNTLNLGNDTIFCPGKAYLLNAGNNYTSYRWQDGSDNNTFTASTPGTYYVTVKDYCNRIFSDTINIIYKNFGINLGKDSTLCLNESMKLTVPAGYLNYNWQPQNNLTYQSPNSVIVNPKVNTSYRVEAEVFSGCKLFDTVQINVLVCPEYIYFPNSFTPNNDGLNDTFKPLTGGVFEKYELQIYNRWGQLVYSTKNKTEGWSGKYKDIFQSSGVFVWFCKYKFFGKEEKFLKGTVNVIK